MHTRKGFGLQFRVQGFGLHNPCTACAVAPATLPDPCHVAAMQNACMARLTISKSGNQQASCTVHMCSVQCAVFLNERCARYYQLYYKLTSPVVVPFFGAGTKWRTMRLQTVSFAQQNKATQLLILWRARLTHSSALSLFGTSRVTQRMPAISVGPSAWEQPRWRQTVRNRRAHL